jgi:hypothetical protein
MDRRFVTVTNIWEKATILRKAWARMRPTKSFFTMTLEEFEKLIAASGEARTELAELDARRRVVVARCEEADQITRRVVLRIVNGVKGDPEEGEDGELLAAMGYLPHTARSSIASMARRKKAGEKDSKATVAKEEEA